MIELLTLAAATVLDNLVLSACLFVLGVAIAWWIDRGESD